MTFDELDPGGGGWVWLAPREMIRPVRAAACLTGVCGLWSVVGGSRRGS